MKLSPQVNKGISLLLSATLAPERRRRGRGGRWAGRPTWRRRAASSWPRSTAAAAAARETDAGQGGQMVIANLAPFVDSSGICCQLIGQKHFRPFDPFLFFH